MSNHHTASDHPGQPPHDEHGPLNGAALTAGLTRAAGVALVAVIVAGYAAGCSPSVTRKPTTAPPAAAQDATDRACYRLHQYGIDDLTRPAVEGDVTYYASLPGVAKPVKDAIAGYWSDPRVSNLTPKGNRDAANIQYGKADAACKDNGWSPGLGHSGLPPKK